MSRTSLFHTVQKGEEKGEKNTEKYQKQTKKNAPMANLELGNNEFLNECLYTNKKKCDNAWKVAKEEKK